jgi:hypothetical protein
VFGGAGRFVVAPTANEADPSLHGVQRVLHYGPVLPYRMPS